MEIVLQSQVLEETMGTSTLGSQLRKKWRGKGLGHVLLTELIEDVEKRWHPKNIYHLHVVSANTQAGHLYESLGFCIIASFPQWFEYNKGYLDEHLLILDKKTFFSAKKNLFK